MNTELQKHLQRVRLPFESMEAQVPADFVSRVLAERDGRRERERSFTVVAAVSAAVAMAVLGWSGLQGPAVIAEPACLGWLEMESETSNP